MWFYAKDDVRERLVYLVSPELEFRYKMSDTSSLIMAALRRHVPMSVEDYEPFVKANPRFFVAGNGEGDWIVPHMRESRFEMIPVRAPRPFIKRRLPQAADSGGSMWPWSKNKTPNPPASLRETFFGDLPLSTWAGDKSAEPWRTFATAASCLDGGDRAGAIQALQSIVGSTALESRHYLEAWNALRQVGVPPRPDEAKHVYGVVVDVPMQSSFDTLAAYEDRKARYINFSGGAIIWDAPDSRMDSHVRSLLTAGQDLAKLIGPWEGERPPLVTGQARISLLTPSGLHFGQADFDTLAQDAMGAPVIAAATQLMQALIELAKPKK